MNQYVALIRGLNVGGKNLVKMVELKDCFEQEGFSNVATYIQSGNVIFESSGSSLEKLTRCIEKALAKRFDCQTTLALRTRRQLQGIVNGAPKGFGSAPSKYRYDVIFLAGPLTAREAFEQILTKPGVDQAHAGVGVLYFSRLTSKASQSRLSRIVSLPIYKSMTIRNWNTTTKLVELMSNT